MHVQRQIAARSSESCCHGNATVRFLFIVGGADVSINH